MMEISADQLKQNSSKEIEQIINDEFFKLHDKIKSVNINEMFSDNNDKITITLPNDETNEYFENFIMHLSDAVKEDVNLDLLTNKLESKFPNKEFWVYIKKIVNNRIIPYKISSFIRKMSVDIKYNFFREILENQVIEEDAIQSIIQRLSNAVDEKQIEIGIKIIEVLVDFIIVKRMTRIRFIGEVKDLFGFDETDSIFLWDILFKHKQELANRYIINQITEIRDILANN